MKVISADSAVGRRDLPRQEKLIGWWRLQGSGSPVSEQQQSPESSAPLHSSSEDTDSARFRTAPAGLCSFASLAVPRIDWMVKLERGAAEHLLPLS